MWSLSNVITLHQTEQSHTQRSWTPLLFEVLPSLNFLSWFFWQSFHLTIYLSPLFLLRNVFFSQERVVGRWPELFLPEKLKFRIQMYPKTRISNLFVRKTRKFIFPENLSFKFICPEKKNLVYIYMYLFEKKNFLVPKTLPVKNWPNIN